MLEKELGRLFTGAEFKILEEADSTNNVARALALAGAREYTCVLARRQTGGRGRLGRQFFSYDGGIYLSVLLRPDILPQDSLLITVAAAAAVAEAIGELSGKRTQIKWVNDIYIDGKKVCGILTEGGITSGRLDFAVLGIGINLFGCKGGFPAEIRDIAGHILDTAADDAQIGRLIGLILQKFDRYYKNLQKKDYLAVYRERNMLQQREITYERDGGIYSGRVEGIDDGAALVVERDGKQIRLSYGEVQIKDFKR